MPFHVCTDDAHTAYWLTLFHATPDSMLSLSLYLSLSLSHRARTNRVFVSVSFFVSKIFENVRKSGILDKSVQRYRNKFPESWPPPRSLPVKPDSDSEPVSSHCYAKAGLRVRGEGRSKGRERVQKGRRRCKARCKATVKRYHASVVTIYPTFDQRLCPALLLPVI